MKKRVLVAFIVCAILLTFTACTENKEEYGVGSGTASRADISYPDPSSGMQFESSLVISGDWTIVSKTQN